MYGLQHRFPCMTGFYLPFDAAHIEHEVLPISFGMENRPIMQLSICNSAYNWIMQS